MSWWKLIRVATAKPRRPMKKTERQKRLEDLLDVQGIEANMMEVEVEELMVEGELSSRGVMVELMMILNPLNMGLSI